MRSDLLNVMKQYLFLYPVVEYFNAFFNDETHKKGLEKRGCKPEYINEIIDARYKKKAME